MNIIETKEESVFIVDFIGEVWAAVATELGIYINYVYGEVPDIVKNLKDKDKSFSQKNNKYVLGALYMPFTEVRGVELYSNVSIRRITIATLTNSNDEPMARYQKTFKPILMPVYESFLRKFAQSRYISCKDPQSIQHTKVDVFGSQAVSGMNDYIDAINIENLSFSFNQTKFC